MVMPSATPAMLLECSSVVLTGVTMFLARSNRLWLLAEVATSVLVSRTWYLDTTLQHHGSRDPASFGKYSCYEPLHVETSAPLEVQHLAWATLHFQTGKARRASSPARVQALRHRLG